MEKKFKVPSIAAEIGIAVVLIILILLTLNYFGIIPISRTVPFMGFLPTQSGGGFNSSSVLRSMGGGGEDPMTLKTIIRSPQPREIENTTANMIYAPVASSSVTVVNNFTLDVELTATSSQNTSSAASGLIFKNNFKPEEEEFRSVGIFYSPQEKKWSLVTVVRNKFQYFPLKNANAQGPNYIKTYLEFSNRGKTVNAFVAGERKKTYLLSVPLFNGNIPMDMAAQVAPGSALNIYGIYYKY